MLVAVQILHIQSHSDHNYYPGGTYFSPSPPQDGAGVYAVLCLCLLHPLPLLVCTPYSATLRVLVHCFLVAAGAETGTRIKFFGLQVSFISNTHHTAEKLTDDLFFTFQASKQNALNH